MKPFILFAALFFSFNLFSQQNNSVEINRYLEKSTRQKRAGNILLISGGTLMVTGIIFVAAGKDDTTWFFSPQQLIGAAMFSAGTLSSLGAIPFYILSGKNKSKAMKISPNAASFKVNEKDYLTAGIKIEF